LGLVGYGSIGSAVAQLAHAYGMRVLACKRDPGVHAVPRWNPTGAGDPTGTLPERWFGPQQLHEMLGLCDYVVLAVPVTSATRNMIGEDALRAMSRQAIFVNVGRGALVQEPALARALREGWIAGAAIDVTCREPLPAESELYDAPNLIITPHISSATRRYYERLTDLFLLNLERFSAGSPLLNTLNRDLGY
jgi:phosphoglycerate dehydrogenase-like enzyme